MNKEFNTSTETIKKAHEIAFNAMVVSRNDTNGLKDWVSEGLGSQELIYLDDELVIKAEGDIDCLQTVENYTLPLRVDLIAKTNSTNIRIYYNAGSLTFNWECDLDSLIVHDIIFASEQYNDKGGRIPVDEFVDISWVIEKRYMEVYVNGELRLKHDSYPYIGLLMIEPNRKIIAPVRIAAAWGSTVTVKSLKVTEL